MVNKYTIRFAFDKKQNLQAVAKIQNSYQLDHEADFFSLPSSTSSLLFLV